MTTMVPMTGATTLEQSHWKTNMNKKELNQKLSDLEAEAVKLRSLINVTPEPRKPEAGDVWEHSGTAWLVTDEGHWVSVEVHMPKNLGKNTGEFSPEGDSDFKNLGKFSEVYVKRDDFIADVRDALSFKDEMGDSVLCRPSSGLGVDLQSIYVRPKGAIKLREALAKLGITAK